ncbi:MAG: tRNA (guanosine(46)-N7)-methyltransferase TrmB [Candidatus Planktophila sp.]
METRSVRTYRLRGSRITRSQASALDRFWSTYGIEIPEGKLDLPALFPDSKKIIMEIGFGMGEATALIGQDFPDVGFLAVEVHFPGVGKLMARIEELSLKNIRIMETDVHILFEDHLEDESLDGIHLFFPDPWPKKKHHKRRIVNPEFLTLVASKIKSGGFIHIATDWVPYAEVIEEVFAASDHYFGGVVPRPEWRPMTRFEGQGITKDHQVTDLRYFKK